jgi:glycosyltransferase involved in cell wall biosynthesis
MEHPKRVCIVSPIFPNGAETAPGIERFVGGICSGLRKKGASIRVVTTQKRGEPPRELRDDIEFVRIPDLARHIGRISGLFSANLYYFAHSLIRRPSLVDGFDLTIFNMPFDSIPRLANKAALGTTAVVLQHREYWSSPSLALSIPAADVMVWRSRPDFFVVPSRYSLAQFAELTRASPDRFQVIPWGVDHSKFRTESMSTARWRAERRGPLLLYVGTGEKRKNIGVLLDAFSRVLIEIPEARLVVVGPGHRKSMQTAQEKGLASKTRFTGVVTEDELIRFYITSDLLVSASTREGFGFTFLEAMACGKPVVAIRAGSIPEVVKEGGMLVDSACPRSIAGAICTLLLSEEEYIRCATRARRVATEHSWEKAADLFLRLCASRRTLPEAA